VFEQASLPEYVAAIVVEPVLGEGGFVPAPLEWVQAVREICDRHGILLIVDEVQTGFCRTGRLFASDYWAEAGVQPDILATAKSIAAGLPLSAIIAREEITESVPAGVIGGTFGGNAVACAAGLAVLRVMERDQLARRAIEIGAVVTSRYHAWAERFDVIGDIRGLGAMIGLEFVKDRTTKEPYPELVRDLIGEAASRGLIIESAGTYGNVIRFLAPLVITDAQLAAGLDILEASLEASVAPRVLQAAGSPGAS